MWCTDCLIGGESFLLKLSFLCLCNSLCSRPNSTAACHHSVVLSFPKIADTNTTSKREKAQTTRKKQQHLTRSKKRINQSKESMFLTMKMTFLRPLTPHARKALHSSNICFPSIHALLQGSKHSRGCLWYFAWGRRGCKTKSQK